MIIMIDNYDSFTFNIVQYFRELKQEVKVFKNDIISHEGIFELSPRALVISPGPSVPAKAGISNGVIREALKRDLPIFGICLGYQCIAKVFGGRIIHAPDIMHGKVSEIYHNGQSIFSNLPSPFNAVRYHSLVVSDLPKCLEVIAWTKDNTIMALQHKNLPVYGVQFHPESILSECGYQIIQNFLDLI